MATMAKQSLGQPPGQGDQRLPNDRGCYMVTGGKN